MIYYDNKIIKLMNQQNVIFCTWSLFFDIIFFCGLTFQNFIKRK